MTKAIIICTMLLIHHNSHAQNFHKNAIKIGLIEPFLHTALLSYERFSEDTSFSIQFSTLLTKRSLNVWEGIQADVSGYGAEIQGRYNFKDGFNYKLYFGVFAKYSQHNFQINIPAGKIDILKGTSKNLGVVGGYRLFFTKHRLFLDCSYGAGWHFADYSGKFSDKGRIIPSIISNGIFPKFDLSIAYKF